MNLPQILRRFKDAVKNRFHINHSISQQPMEFLRSRQKQALIVLSLLVILNLVWLSFYRTGLGSIRNWTNRILLGGSCAAFALILYYPVNSKFFRRAYIGFLGWYLSVVYIQTFYFTVFVEHGLRSDFTELFIAANNTVGVILVLGVLLEHRHILYFTGFMAALLSMVGLFDTNPLLRSDLYLPLTFVLAISIIIFFWSGTLNKILSSFVDLRQSLKKKVREQTDRLRLQKNLLRKTEETAKTGGWVYDVTDETFRWTEGTRNIHGVDDDFEISLESTIKLYHPEDREDLKQKLKRCRTQGESFDETYRIISSGSDARWVRVRARAQWEQGELVEVQGAVQDVTRRKNLRNQLRKEKQRAQKLASIDPLTDLMNRRTLMNHLEQELNRAREIDVELSLAMIDIDHFSKINNQYGHQQGDRVLETLGQRLREETRDNDLPGRYGGEEFIVVFPGTDKSGAKVVMERFRKSLKNVSFNVEDTSFQVTCSIGISKLRDFDDDRDDLIGRADSALYQAKDRGRDQTLLM